MSDPAQARNTPLPVLCHEAGGVNPVWGTGPTHQRDNTQGRGKNIMSTAINYRDGGWVNVQFTHKVEFIKCIRCHDRIWPRRPIASGAVCDITSSVRSHLCVIIPIEVTHKNVPSIAADFTPARGPATASVLGAFLRLKLHFDPRSCLARRGELAEPTIQHLLPKTDN